MKKYFVVADVHGFYNEMCKALADAGYDKKNPDHVFVSLGDLLDRGPAAKQCLEFVNSLSNNNKILILGNHELLMNHLLTSGAPSYADVTNGTLGTVAQLEPEAYNTWDKIERMHSNVFWKQYYNSLTPYAEVGNNVFVHGWIPHIDYQNASLYEWQEATWQNGMRLWSQGEFIPGKTIWCGHWHTSWGHANLHHYGVEFLEDDWKYHKADAQGNFECFDPFIDEGIVAMDACTVYSHKVNCLSFEN